MKRLLFLILAFGALLIPQPAHAGILPGCDRTIYAVPAGGYLKSKIDTSDDRENPVPYYDHIITPELYAASPLSYEMEGTASEDVGNFQVGINRPCGLNDFVQLFVNLANWGFSILAITAVFFFIWGGFTWLIAGGRQEYIETGKRTVEGTFVGVIIVLTAWILVNFYITGLVGESSATFIGKEVPFPLGGTTCAEEFTNNDASGGRTSACTTGDLIFGCTDDSGAGSVQQVQTALNKRCNQLCGPANGCYGNQTAHCVRMFQAANGIPVTGEVDPTTWAAIQDPSANDCLPLEYPNPIGIPDYDNVFPYNATPYAFGSCISQKSPERYSCIPAHGPFDCPPDSGTLQADYAYSPSPCVFF